MILKIIIIIKPVKVLAYFRLSNDLGPDIGYINNTKQWQKTTPQSFSSPFYCQADIGNYIAY
jgi:hypothetical protein